MLAKASHPPPYQGDLATSIKGRYPKPYSLDL